MTEALGERTGRALGWRGAQLVGHKLIFLVRLVVLARILGPTAFGLLTIAQTAIGVMNQVTDLGMVPALVQKPTPERRHYDAAWTVNLIRGLVVTTVVVAAAPLVSRLFGAPEATDVVRVLAASPLLLAASSIGLADLHRAMDFRSLAYIDLGQALVNTVVSIALAARFGVWALIVGALAGAATHLALSYVLAPRQPRLVLDRETIRPLVDFGRWILLTAIIGVVGHFVLKAVISSRLGVAELGLYYMASQIAFLPVEVATQVGGSVAFPLFARVQEQARKAARGFRSLVVGMAGFLLPVCALLFALAPSLVAHVLGDRWAGTGSAIRVLALVPVIGMLGEASIPLLKGLGRPSRLAVIEAVQSALLVVSVWTLTSAFGLVGAVSAWIPATLASQVAAAVYVARALDRPLRGLAAPLVSIVVASAVAAGLAFLVDAWVGARFGGLIGLLAGGVLGGVAVLGLLWLADRRLGGRFEAILRELVPASGRVGRWLGVPTRPGRAASEGEP